MYNHIEITSYNHLSCVFRLSGPSFFLCYLRHCLRKPNARVNRQCTFVPTPSHFRLLLEGSKRNFAYATTVPSTFLLIGMPCSTLQGHQSAGSKAHTATCKAWRTSCSHTLQRHQHPGSKALSTDTTNFRYFHFLNENITTYSNLS